MIFIQVMFGIVFGVLLLILLAVFLCFTYDKYQAEAGLHKGCWKVLVDEVEDLEKKAKIKAAIFEADLKGDEATLEQIKIRVVDILKKQTQMKESLA